MIDRDNVNKTRSIKSHSFARAAEEAEFSEQKAKRELESVCARNASLMGEIETARRDIDRLKDECRYDHVQFLYWVYMVLGMALSRE